MDPAKGQEYHSVLPLSGLFYHGKQTSGKTERQRLMGPFHWQRDATWQCGHTVHRVLPHCARCCSVLHVGQSGGGGQRSPHCPLANLGGTSGPPRSKIGGGAGDPPSNRILWGASDPQAKLLRGLLLSLVRLVFDLLLKTTHLLS